MLTLLSKQSSLFKVALQFQIHFLPCFTLHHRYLMPTLTPSVQIHCAFLHSQHLSQKSDQLFIRLPLFGWSRNRYSHKLFIDLCNPTVFAVRFRLNNHSTSLSERYDAFGEGEDRFGLHFFLFFMMFQHIYDIWVYANMEQIIEVMSFVYNFSLDQKTSMKKVTSRQTLEFKIEAFARSPLGELKMSMKQNHEKQLKKISRNRLHRDPILPHLNKPTSKSNQQNTLPIQPSPLCKQPSLDRVICRNRSYMKPKTAHLDSTPLKIISNSQKGFKINEEMKKIITGNHARGKLVITRNCMSAEVKKDNAAKIDQIPENVRELRRVLHKKKSSLDLRSQESRDIKIPLLVQAQRLAYLCKSSDMVENKQPFLQDFLNQWKQMNLP